MPLRTISPAEARRLVGAGAILVDVREADEHARESIPGTHLLPLSRLDEDDLALRPGKAVIFHCRSGARTRTHDARLAAKAGDAREAYVLEGGLEAWKSAGLPVSTDQKVE